MSSTWLEDTIGLVGCNFWKFQNKVALVNDFGRMEGKIFFASIARGNLQVHWPEGNVIIRRGVVSEVGGVPDYNAQARVEKM